MRGTVLCLDVGGTYIRVGRYDPVSQSHVIVGRTSTLPEPGGEGSPRLTRFLESLRDAVHASLEVGDIAVSIALAGPVSTDGRVWALPTIVRSEQINLDAGHLRGILDVPKLYLLNDMTAAAYGLLSPERNTYCVATIGTGLGVRLVIGGEPVVGSLGMAGEIGHVRVDFSDHPRRCDCGGVGHLGGLASGRGVASSNAQSVDLLRDPGLDQAGDPFGFVRAYRAGDRAATDEVVRQGTLLGRTLAPVLTACGISDLVLMGGAVEAMQPDYAAAVQKALDNCTWDVIRAQQPPQVSVEFDSSLPLLGAGRFAVIRDR